MTDGGKTIERGGGLVKQETKKVNEEGKGNREEKNGWGGKENYVINNKSPHRDRKKGPLIKVLTINCMVRSSN